MQILEHDMAWDCTARPTSIAFEHIVPKPISDPIFTEVFESFPISSGLNPSLTALKPLQDLAGHYCLDNRKEEWFLRITRRRRKNPDLEEDIAFYLDEQGIKVNLPLKRATTIHWRGHDYLLSVFPRIEGRHFDGSERDLIAVCDCLSRTHVALNSFPLANQIRSASVLTAEKLFNLQDRMLRAFETDDLSMFHERSDWVYRNHAWMKTMVESFNPALCSLPNAQPVHGEIHLGNVIFSSFDGSAVLTDFEETTDSWFPISFDLSYLIQRFCFDGQPKRHLLQERLKIVEGFFSYSTRDLQEMMRQVCWHVLAGIVGRCERREAVVPGEEYEKFLKLEHLSNQVIPDSQDVFG